MANWIVPENWEDVPKDKYFWFTIERANGERKSTVMKLDLLWAGTKLVAYIPKETQWKARHTEIPVPYEQRI